MTLRLTGNAQDRVIQCHYPPYEQYNCLCKSSFPKLSTTTPSSPPYSSSSSSSNRPRFVLLPNPPHNFDSYLSRLPFFSNHCNLHTIEMDYYWTYEHQYDTWTCCRCWREWTDLRQHYPQGLPCRFCGHGPCERCPGQVYHEDSAFLD